MGFLYIALGLYGLIFKATFADFDMIILGDKFKGYSLVIRSRKKLLEKCIFFIKKKASQKVNVPFQAGETKRKEYLL